MPVELKDVLANGTSINNMLIDGIFQLKDTVFEDVTVPAGTMTDSGFPSPPMKPFMNKQTVVGTPYSVSFNAANTTYVDLVDIAFEDDWQMAFWIRPVYDRDKVYVVDNVGFGIRINRLKFEMRHITVTGNSWVNMGVVARDSANALYISYSHQGSNGVLSVWTNDVLEEVIGTPATASSDKVMYLGSLADGTNGFEGEFDELRFWNKSFGDIGDMGINWYNGGQGQPLITWFNANLLHAYSFNETSGTTISDQVGSVDFTTFNGNLMQPFIIGVGSYYSIGVHSRAFEPNLTQSVGFNAQMPHGKKTGTDICPHFHASFKIPPQPGETIVFLFEYTWADIANIGGNPTQTVFPETEVLELVIPIGNNAAPINSHMMTPWMTDVNFSVEAGVSAMILCSLTRVGSDARDTYPGDIFMHEFDFHVQIDTLGSKDAAVK